MSGDSDNDTQYIQLPLDLLPDENNSLDNEDLPLYSEETLNSISPSHQIKNCVEAFHRISDSISEEEDSDYQPLSESEVSDDSLPPLKKIRKQTSHQKISKCMSTENSDIDYPKETHRKTHTEYESQQIPISEDKSKQSSDKPRTPLSIDDPHNPDPNSDFLAESDVLRFKDRPGLWIRKIKKSLTTVTGKAKKSDRVYNTYQWCAICQKKMSNWKQHILRKHTKIKEVKDILLIPDSTAQNEAFCILRAEHNHLYNMMSIQKGVGEILLQRRMNGDSNGEGEEDHDEDTQIRFKTIGPCHNCHGWMKRKHLYRHQSTCKANRHKDKRLSLPLLSTLSDLASSQIQFDADLSLRNEVFARMRPDDITRIAQTDRIIIAIGNIWIKRHVGNPLKRSKYTRSTLRLLSNLLLNIRQLTGNNHMDMWSALVPDNYKLLVKATLVAAGKEYDGLDYTDRNELQALSSPSNAVKLGFELKRMLGVKRAMAILEKRPCGEDCCRRFTLRYSDFLGI